MLKHDYVASPAPPLEGTAVLGVVIQLSHALLEKVSHLTALQIRQRQLVLSADKGLVREDKTPTHRFLSSLWSIPGICRTDLSV